LDKEQRIKKRRKAEKEILLTKAIFMSTIESHKAKNQLM
jgi:hypothetical protein